MKQHGGNDVICKQQLEWTVTLYTHRSSNALFSKWADSKIYSISSFLFSEQGYRNDWRPNHWDPDSQWHGNGTLQLPTEAVNRNADVWAADWLVQRETGDSNGTAYWCKWRCGYAQWQSGNYKIIAFICLAWSSVWGWSWERLLLVTDVSTTWVVVIFGVKWLPLIYQINFHITYSVID